MLGVARPSSRAMRKVDRLDVVALPSVAAGCGPCYIEACLNR